MHQKMRDFNCFSLCGMFLAEDFRLGLVSSASHRVSNKVIFQSQRVTSCKG
jgi:hypothetical protein